MTKRQKIVTTTLLVTLGWICLTFTDIVLFYGYRVILPFALLVYLLSLWSLSEGMTRLKATILLILPVLFAISAPLFYLVGHQLWGVRWTSRLPAAAIFGLLFYSLLLSQNVFNVAANRTIPLYRAASTVSLVFTIITSVFLYSVIFAYNLPFFLNGLLVSAITFPLVIQLLWSVEMERVTPAILIYSLIVSLVLGEVALAFSFWPLVWVIWSISLALTLYVLVGIVLEYFRDRFSKNVVWEYLGIGAVVFIFTFLVTSWT